MTTSLRYTTLHYTHTHLHRQLRNPGGRFVQGRDERDVHVHVERGQADRRQPEEVDPRVAQVAVQDRLEA